MVVLTHHHFRGADSPQNIFSTLLILIVIVAIPRAHIFVVIVVFIIVISVVFASALGTQRAFDQLLASRPFPLALRARSARASSRQTRSKTKRN
jgi:hypothetical protein